MLSSSLVKLPEEVLINVGERLDVISLLSLRLTCKRLNSIVDKSVTLQYQIELHVQGKSDGPQEVGMVADERLSLLRRYRCSWDSFRPSSIHRVQTFPAEFYNECGGVYGECSAFVPRHTSNVFHQSLVFQTLPTRRRNSLNMSSWTLTDLPHNIDDFNMDPSQDLLITLHFPRSREDEDWRIVKLHVLSLQDGKKHPLATVGIIKNDITANVRGYTARHTLIHRGWALKICHNLVCTLHNYDLGSANHDLITLWDWITGSRLLILRGNGISSCSFFSPNYLLLAMIGCSVYRPQTGDNQARIAICDIKQTAIVQETQPNAFADVCELQLPPLKPTAAIRLIYIRTHTHTKDQPSAVFKPSPHDRLFAIHILAETRHLGNHEHTYRILVPFSTIESHMKQITRCISFDTVVLRYPGSGPRLYTPSSSFPEGHEVRQISVPWSLWIPEGTRLFYNAGDITQVERNRFFLVYGLRFLPPPMVSSDSVEIMDFNLRPSRRKHAIPPEVEENSANDNQPTLSTRQVIDADDPQVQNVDVSLVTSPSVLSVGDCSIFSEDVVTRLPYRHIKIYFDRIVNDAFLTEDSIFLDVGHRGEYTALCF